MLVLYLIRLFEAVFPRLLQYFPQCIAPPFLSLLAIVIVLPEAVDNTAL